MIWKEFLKMLGLFKNIKESKPENIKKIQDKKIKKVKSEKMEIL